MTSNRQLSPLRAIAYVAGAAVLVSLFAPSAAGVLGPLAVFVLLVAVYLLMFKRPVGRPPKDTARRLSGYRVRSGYTLLPESLLLGLALWSIADLHKAPTTSSSAAAFGALAGAAWAAATRISLGTARIAKGVLGAVGLLTSFFALTQTDGCSQALPPTVVALIGLVLLAAFGTAVFVGIWKRATLRRADLPSFILAALGIVELVEFAVAPTGHAITTELPGGFAPVALVAGILVAAALAAINPRATEAMLGVGTAAGIAFLLLLQLQQLSPAVGPGCVDVLPQLVMVTVFTLIAVKAGSGRSA